MTTQDNFRKIEDGMRENVVQSCPKTTKCQLKLESMQNLLKDNLVQGSPETKSENIKK